MGIDSSVEVLMTRVDVDDDDGLAGEGDIISRFDDFFGDRKRPKPFFLPEGDDLLFSVDEEVARETPSREDSTDEDEDAPIVVPVLVVVADTLATSLACCCFSFKSRSQKASWDSDCVGAKYSWRVCVSPLGHFLWSLSSLSFSLLS